MSPIYLWVLTIVFALSCAAEGNPKSVLGKQGINIRPDPGAALIMSVVLIVISGLRYFVGTDYFSYYRNRVTDLSVVWKSIIAFREPGIKLLSFMSHSIYDNGQSLIFLSSLITIGLYCCVIYRYHAETMYLVSMLMYLFLGEWQGSFNCVRQYLAAAIMLAGHRYILDQDWKKYFAIVLLGALFHTTALVMIIPYFLFTRKPDIKQIVILAICAIITRFSYSFIFTLIEGYKGHALNVAGDAYLTNDVNIFRILVAFVPVLIYLVFGNKENHTKETDFYLNIVYFNAFSMFASMGSTYLARIGIYSGAALPIGWGYLFRTITDERTRKILIYVSLVLYLFYWIYSLQSASLRTFHWIFEGI